MPIPLSKEFGNNFPELAVEQSNSGHTPVLRGRCRLKPIDHAFTGLDQCDQTKSRKILLSHSSGMSQEVTDISPRPLIYGCELCSVHTRFTTSSEPSKKSNGPLMDRLNR